MHGNRRRIKGERGRRLLRRRGEFLERSFAHCCETGNLRRLYLRGRDNIAKRLLVHAAGFNLGLLMRVGYGLKKPRGLTRTAAACVAAALSMFSAVWASLRRLLTDRVAHRRSDPPTLATGPWRLAIAA